MIHLAAHLPNLQSDTAIAVPPLMVGEDGTNLLLQRLMLVADQRGFLLIVESAAGQFGDLEQASQGELLP